MKKIIYSTVLLVIAFFILGLQQSPTSTHEGVVSSYLVKGLSTDQMDQVADRFEVVRKLGDHAYEVYVLKSQSEELVKLAPRATLLQENIAEDLLSTDLLSYPTYQEVLQIAEQYEEQYPNIVKVVPYGASLQGRTLWAIKISDQVEQDEPQEKRVLFLTATHGDELITVRVALARIEELLNGYGQNQRMTQLVNDHEIYFVPITNPDGYAIKSRYANGEDPNRSYPWPEKTQVKSSKCIADLIAFFHDKKFDGVIDIHAFGRMLMYPWAYTRNPLEKQKELDHYENLGRFMNDKAQYNFGQISKVIYIAKGSSADYFHWKGSTSFAIEVGYSKAPRERDVQQVLENTKEMIWRFVEGL